MSDCWHIRCEPFPTCQLNVEIELAYLDRGDGTGGLIKVADIRALSGYVEQRAGVTNILGCGCTGRVECGYHREQAERTRADLLAHAVSRNRPPLTDVLSIPQRRTEMTMTDTTTEKIRYEHETAAAALRDLLAETEGARRNGPASDGRGWFRNQADRDDCYAVADAMLPLLTASWEYGVYYNRNDSDVHICDDQDHAAEWKRDLNWDGPVVRRLTARLTRQDWTESQR